MERDLQQRLINFSSLCIQLKKSAERSFEGDHFGKQLIRSSSSAALNFGEAKGAESDKDFLHKQSIILKELRESQINLQIFKQNELSVDNAAVMRAIDECDQLVRIFVASVLKIKRKLGIDKQH
jgi:four helix bundle protein